jgi:hypothetical protein
MKFAPSLLLLAVLLGCSHPKELTNPHIVADLTKDISDVCPLHHKRMTKTAALVHYRLLVSADRIPALTIYDNAQKSLFPFGETIYTTTDPTFPNPSGVEGIDQVWLYVCQDCRVIGEAWTDEWRYGKKKG